MILRDPEYADYKWITECYEDWPMGNEGPVTDQKAVDWLRRWLVRGDIKCRVLQDAEPLGLITYTRDLFTCVVKNIVVRPKYRGHGASTKMIRFLRDELVADGVVVAEFDTLPGIIRNQLGTRYQDLGGGRGRLVWDMEL